jgi:hypothetical protein
LKTREGIDRHGVGVDARDVAERRSVALCEKHTHAVAETGEVGTRDRAAYGEGDLVRRGCRHLPVGPLQCRELIAWHQVDSRGDHM